MYTRTDNPCTSCRVIDNAADEALAGYGKKIKVTCTPTARSAWRTTAAAFPSACTPRRRRPVVELVFTRLHAGGKFDKGNGRRLQLLGRPARRGREVTNALARAWRPPWRDGQVATLVFSGA
jgi:topoisomerase-4 subunit B